mmetsp:Transcript_1032/g.2018  ORF Transcript_1032/g.2018 Transcript_1032/m.2018 type:complete len:340 (-) Transcript_1032:586-1605(-)|eukprot:CAMPEP_0185852860 /NCGR_PEP_ID=MMETSP1354-20130828/16580_1 /TAXON_ID=708628 /ORGANISM="Erythrolobus madagascarensis, Strain CCMP3276" /LENGTH=339 /DNA_ID=CAMNT_0028554209 /DNA_START=1 /DNA_END=1020 /DNA_ORIENTATION=+
MKRRSNKGRSVSAGDRNSSEGRNESDTGEGFKLGRLEHRMSAPLPPVNHQKHGGGSSTSSGKGKANGRMMRTSSSKKLLMAGSPEGLESGMPKRGKSTLTLAGIRGDLVRDPSEGGSFRSFHSSRRRDVFQHLSGAEKTTFVSKLKYDDILFEIEDTLIEQQGVDFVRKKNVFHFEVELPKFVLLGEIKIVELINECRVEFRKSDRDKRTDYWTFVEYYRRFERDLRARSPDAVVSKRTVREVYREQKANQQTVALRDKALQIERNMKAESGANGNAADSSNTSEYKRLQKMFQELPEDSTDEVLHSSNDKQPSSENIQDLQLDALERELVDAVIENES